MANNPQLWLENWVEEHLGVPGYAEDKAAMRECAKLCAADAIAAGISISQLKEAAGGDLEAYLLEQQNAGTDRELRDKIEEE